MTYTRINLGTSAGVHSDAPTGSGIEGCVAI
ncbi:unnamed protein product [Protopolystoma xenopodis]|uniref:Uncharacterized protein n=1 Tax=Protopolystoma xenopodis TaxID=117903 RepID=A0A3S5C2Q2_9PLAT|nr:unnamed protein product [Protopolystoma xenopodis]